MMKRTRKTFYRKKTAPLPKEKKSLKKADNKDEFFDEYIAPALSTNNLKHQALSFSILFLALLLIFSVIQGALMYLNYTDAKQKHSQALRDLAYWEQVIDEHPGAPDVYYNAAIYAGKLGDKEKAKKYLRTATILDPEFHEARILEEVINSR